MNYPGGVKNNITSKLDITYGNRGMSLENDINDTNQYYRDIDKAIIYKKPVPIKVSEVDYKSQGKLIRKAYFESPSTTDYNGVYKGRYIDFEAKETMNKTSFPLSNIHEHQINHIKRILEHDGICFLIVRFVKLNKTYLLLGDDFKNFIDKNDRNSIPESYFMEYGYIIKDKYIPKVDYLEIIDKLISGGVL